MSTDYRRARRRASGQPTWRLIRYADDFVVLVHGTRADVDALREEVAEVLAPMGLRFSAAKTQVVNLSDGFDFLGHADIRIMPTSPESPCSPAVNRIRLSA